MGIRRVQRQYTAGQKANGYRHHGEGVELGRKARGYYTKGGDPHFTKLDNWVKELAKDKALRKALHNTDLEPGGTAVLKQLMKSDNFIVEDFAKGFNVRLPEIIRREYHLDPKTDYSAYKQKRARVIEYLLSTIP